MTYIPLFCVVRPDVSDYANMLIRLSGMMPRYVGFYYRILLLFYPHYNEDVLLKRHMVGFTCSDMLKYVSDLKPAFGSK
jgi:hypothetical protein